MVFTTNASEADLLSWSTEDELGNIRGSGSFLIAPGPNTYTLICASSYAGYLAIHAALTVQGASLPAAGTRPAGIASFGILPNLTSILPQVSYAYRDQHRFGMQGFNGNNPMLSDLGISQIITNRQMSVMEPTGPNTWSPSGNWNSGQPMSLIRLDGIPAWASPTGTATSGYVPTDLTYFQNFMARVGTDSSEIRKNYYPDQQYSYYQVTWEPENNWKDTQANLVALYKAAYNGLHSTDPQAIVAGPTSGLLNNDSVNLLKQLAPLGFANYVDAISTHPYYYGYDMPSYAPETTPSASGGLDQQMRALRAEMQADYKPNMKLLATEVGISYDRGITYGSGAISANQLYAQAALTARTHLIVLGEGAQVTYFFFGPDYPSEVGFGTFFDLVDAQGDDAATNLSPKPVALAIAALTHIIDGTNTLGYLNALPTNVHGYAFQQLNGGKVITALWAHNNSVWPDSSGVYEPSYSVPYTLEVDTPGTSGTLVILDLMGNPSTVPYVNGTAKLPLTESPIYVISSNAAVAKSNVTAPVGYTGQ